MTQVFTDDGTRVPVTVIEAGPCPVTAVRDPERDGYAAIQLAFGEVPERRLTLAELGHLKKAGAGPARTLVEFREAGEHQVGDVLKVEQFEPGQQVKVSGIAIGKGFQGTVRRHNFARGPVSHGSHNVRAPGSIGASADPARVFKGVNAGSHGRQAGHAAPAGGRRRRRGAQPAAPQGGGARPAQRHRRGEDGLMARRNPGKSAQRGEGADARQAAKADLPATVFGEEFHESLVHETARADLAARRRGTASALGRGEVAMTTAKAWRQKGTGRARAGALSVPHRRGGGAAFGPKPRGYAVKVNRKARRRALRAALSVHAARGSVAVLDGASFDEPATKRAAEGLDKWGASEPDAGGARHRRDRRR